MEEEATLQCPRDQDGRMAGRPPRQGNPDSPIANPGSSRFPAQFYIQEQPAILEPGGAAGCPPACERRGNGSSFCPLFFPEDLGQSQPVPAISLGGCPALGSLPVPGGNMG
jgi:hypothetical protein